MQQAITEIKHQIYMIKKELMSRVLDWMICEP